MTEEKGNSTSYYMDSGGNSADSTFGWNYSCWTCPYSGKCSSEGLKCASCGRNPNNKRDYYEPIPYVPYVPYYPYYPWSPNITWCTYT